jgi:pentatricopeptide repeat protein
MARFDEGISEAKRAGNLDPSSRVIQSAMASAFVQAGRYDDADSVLRHLMALEPSYANTHRMRVTVLLAQRRNAEAIAAAKTYLAAAGGRLSWAVALLGLAYIANGQSDSARPLLSELLARSSRQEPVNAAGVALLYGGLGNRLEALRWLARAVDEYDPLYNFSHTPMFDAFRSDPRGRALLARIESPNKDLPPIAPK